MKKALSLFAALLALTGLRAQNGQVKKETTKPSSANSQSGNQQTSKPSPPASRTMFLKISKADAQKVNKANVQKPIKRN